MGHRGNLNHWKFFRDDDDEPCLKRCNWAPKLLFHEPINMNPRFSQWCNGKNHGKPA